MLDIIQERVAGLIFSDMGLPVTKSSLVSRTGCDARGIAVVDTLKHGCR
jgi:hypothetical protein